MLRDVLSEPSALSEIAIDGVSEKIPRVQLVQELKELEAEELSLMMKASGRPSRASSRRRNRRPFSQRNRLSKLLTV